MSFSPAQCRAARALLNWSQAQLAAASKVATKTIADFERESRAPYERTLADIERALESAGVEFTNDGQPGVRLMRVEAKCAKCGYTGAIEHQLARVSGVPTQCPTGHNPIACPEFLKAVSAARTALSVPNQETAAKFAAKARGDRPA